jgi:hypothetical protein
MSASRLIVVNCSEKAIENSLSIAEVLGEAKFGETIKVRLNISKGSDAKTSVSVWVEGSEKVSEVTSMNIYTRHSQLELMVPVRLKDGDYDSGTYTLVAEGLGSTDSRQIKIESIENEECEEKTCPKCPACKETKCEKGEIKSFYTLASKYNEKIRLFANVDCANCSIIARSANESQRRSITGPGKVDFNMSFANDYTLDLCKASSSLHLDIEKPAKNEKKTEAKAYPEAKKSTVPPSYQS